MMQAILHDRNCLRGPITGAWDEQSADALRRFGQAAADTRFSSAEATRSTYDALVAYTPLTTCGLLVEAPGGGTAPEVSKQASDRPEPKAFSRRAPQSEDDSPRRASPRSDARPEREAARSPPAYSQRGGGGSSGGNGRTAVGVGAF